MKKINRVVIIGENYVVGGADSMTRFFAEDMGFAEVYLFINIDNDFELLENPPLKNNIIMNKYKIPTLAQMGSYALRYKNKKYLYYLLKFCFVVIRYPYILFLIVYFYMKFLKIKPDIMISNNGGYPGGEINRCALVASFFIKNSKAFHIINNMPTKAPIILYPIECLYDKLLNKFSQTICDSSAIENKMRNIRCFSEKNICVVYLGVQDMYSSLKKYPLVETGKVIRFLSLASFDSRKNQILLIDAIGQLIKEGYKNFSCSLYGRESENGYLAQIKNRIKSLGLSEYVTLHDFEHDIKPVFNNHDVFVLTSKVEGFPLVNLLAMSAGLPVISTIAGGTQEQVQNNITGFILKGFEPEELANAMKQYLQDNVLIMKHGTKGREIYLKNFSKEGMKERYQSCFLGKH